ncbi:MAG: hypothetical protein ACO3AV_05265, partial [Ilumatobacteraceae bacterium]
MEHRTAHTHARRWILATLTVATALSAVAVVPASVSAAPASRSESGDDRKASPALKRREVDPAGLP